MSNAYGGQQAGTCVTGLGWELKKSGERVGLLCPKGSVVPWCQPIVETWRGWGARILECLTFKNQIIWKSELLYEIFRLSNIGNIFTFVKYAL